MSPEDIVAAIALPCAFVSDDARAAAVNDSLAAIIGEGLAGRHYVTAFRQPSAIEPIRAAFSDGTRHVGRFLGRSAGQDVVYQVTASPVMVAGRGAGCLVFLEDTTPFEQAGERRSEFVANVSHELRTPLTAMAGFIETLRGPARDDAEARERFLAIMERETARMNRLVDDLLSLNRVEEMERMPPSERVDVAEVLGNAVRGLAPQAERRGVRLDLTGTDAPAMAPGDGDQLTQVFTNLVENAIKYGRENGRVSVHLSRDEVGEPMRGAGLRVSVEDDGEGIEPHHIGRLTERFYRADSHRSRGMGGTGLGLAIVKHIVNRHRGRLKIDSTPGQGSRFCVFLPQE